ncbi:MAG TPA: MBL fold metallo-hydrolase [Sphaerochaeta sp.]|jgi:metallo-beta-lactamase family protein|nr:MBL fold metallo-hydrolase [Sphaerochaeta sp.]HPY45348.1 MBL fold metallo-hydrolase [Sphaerochaeta sp.]HQB05836.1 MBL fold metallo-hydrolase [Sphaerochaeta sp.]
MDIQFYGANRYVTGSCTLVTGNGKKILIDCGLPQGNDAKIGGLQLPFNAKDIDYLLLTHAHIDHSGRIPLLIKDGFRGTIYATEATKELCSIMLADSAHIQESEAQWQNRKAKRSGQALVEPLYTVNDAYKSLSRFETIEYEEKRTIDEGITIRYQDAGHLLGSALIELWLTEGAETRKLVFTGDLGNLDQPLIKDPVYITEADFVVMESTYGNRNHAPMIDKDGNTITSLYRARELAAIIQRTFDRGGNVIIPAFSVGRTQELLYLLRIIIEEGLCSETVPVFVDSPLSVKATKVFAGNLYGYMDEETMALVNAGINPILFEGLTPVVDVNDSIALNHRKESCVIISSSGMCEAGRIKHHLKHNLWRRECTVIFSGYQASGTLGRSIYDGARHVTIFGDQIDIRCEITELHGTSGHADQQGLIRWLSRFEGEIQRVFVVHGDEEIAPWFASYVQRKLDRDAYAPRFGERFDLLDAESIPKAEPITLTELPYMKDLASALEALSKGESAFGKVLARIKQAAEHTSDEKRSVRLANATRRLASDLEDLAKKWNSDAS